MITLRSLASLVWLWIKITVILAALAFVAGAVRSAVDPLHDVPYVGRNT